MSSWQIKQPKYFDIKELGLKPEGFTGKDEILVKCPYHNDHNPSAVFNIVKGLFYCFGCGTSKNVYQLAKDIDGYVIKTNNNLITENKITEQLWKKLLLNPLAKNNLYLTKRGVTEDQIERYEIKANSRAVIFPLKDENNKTVGVQIRNYVGSPKYLTFGQKPALYPLQEKYHGGKILLTEGIFGYLILDKWGYKSYATLGAMVKSSVNKYLYDRNTIGIFDNDFAGYVACGRTLKFLPRAKVLLPGIDLDKITKDEFEHRLQTDTQSNNLGVVAVFSGNENDYWNRIKDVK